MVIIERHVRFGKNGRFYIIPEARPIDTGTRAITLRLMASIEHGRAVEFARVDLVRDETLKITEHYHIHKVGDPDGPAVMFPQDRPMVIQMLEFAHKFQGNLKKSGYRVDDEATPQEVNEAIVATCGLLPEIYQS